MAVQGRLSEMNLLTLVQLTCQEGSRNRLTIRQDEHEAVLYFDAGNVVHAVLRAAPGGPEVEEGEEVVYRVLTWQDGEFSLQPGADLPVRTITVPWSTLLMTGLQRHDEAQWDTRDLDTIEEEYEMAENLNDILKDLGSQVTGYMACAVVGMDGLNIAQHAAAPVDPEAISAQMTLLFKLVDSTVNKLGAGKFEDIQVTTEKAIVLMRYLGDKDYYLGFAADRRAANLGNMRLNGRIFAERLFKALPR